MNVLDENVPEPEFRKLQLWNIRARWIGHAVGRGGMQDAEIISPLHSLRRPTFFALDGDFYKPTLWHSRYCLVWLNVDDKEAAEYTRRFLKHPEFNTIAKRLGHVIRVAPTEVHVWRPNADSEARLQWPGHDKQSTAAPPAPTARVP